MPRLSTLAAAGALLVAGANAIRGPANPVDIIRASLKSFSKRQSSSGEVDALYVAEMCTPDLISESYLKEIFGDLLPKTVTEANDLADDEEKLKALAVKLGMSFEKSPYPCEQLIYIGAACTAEMTNNKPSKEDYEKEQRCICDSNFWDIDVGCNNCYLAHGMLPGTNSTAFPVPSASEVAHMSTLSSKACQVTPVPSGGIVAILNDDIDRQAEPEAGMSYGEFSDLKFASKTAVSNYYAGGLATVDAGAMAVETGAAGSLNVPKALAGAFIAAAGFML